ncbi:GNAT family N-acetyltransferase [Proteiniborus sp.]|uniref:GNAT family N-acetyltransferase n=1 Tax=Proteiniborus sp. TaxID=2079015 RepID=UPI003327038B
MVHLEEVNWQNYRQCCALKVSEKQKENRSVAPNVAILARAYAYRNEGSCTYIIYNDDEMVGILMYRNYDEPPKCYILDQFMVDERFQGRGYGKIALELVINIMKQERKYSRVELGCSRENVGAMEFYKSCGFYFSGDDSEDEIGMALDF